MFELRLLGAVDLRDARGARIRAVLSRPKRLALLAYLAAQEPGEPIRRDTLLALLWPEFDEGRARNNLNQTVHHLRRALGAESIVVRGDAELWLEPGRVWCDVLAYDAALERDDLEAALELYRGPLLDGFHLSGAPDFERWVDRERARYGRYATTAVAKLIVQAESNPEVAVAWAERGYALAPGDEEALYRLLTTLDAAGRGVAAIEQYEVFARELSAEYGTEPTNRTRALVAEIRQRVEEAPAEPPPAAPEPTAPTSRTASPFPPPAEPAAVAPTRAEGRWGGRLGRLAAVLVVVLVIAGMAGRILDGRSSAVAASVSTVSRVAVLPFTTRGEDERIAYLGEGLADVLATRLDGLGELRTVDSNLLIGHVQGLGGRPPFEQGRAAARHFGARYFVIGNVTEVGDRLDVNASLYDANGALRTRAHASVGESELLTAMDELTRQLVRGQVDGVNAHLLRAATVTTRSLPALEAYLEGERAYRENRLDDMRASLERAVAEDSTFALAYYRLAIAMEWTGATPRDIHRTVENAARYRDRLSERHRLLLEAQQAYWRGNFAEAEEVYRRTVLRYPDDLDAWHRLAELQFHRMPALGRPFTEAREAFERVLALEPDEVGALHHLTRIAAHEGRAAELDGLTARALPGAEANQAIELRVVRAFANGTAAERARASAEAEALPDDDAQVTALRVASYTADVRGAETLLARLLESDRPPEVRVLAQLQMADFAAAAGRWREARRRLQELEPVAPVLALALEASHAILPFAPIDRAELIDLRERVADWNLAPAGVDSVSGRLSLPVHGRPALRRFFLGALSVRLGDAAGVDAQMEALLGDSVAVEYRFPTKLRAMAALASGRTAEGLAAVDSLTPGDPALEFARQAALGRYLRGELLRAAGRDEDAAGWFGSFGDLLGWDLAFLAPGELERAEIAEGRGDPDAAARHYARVVALWRDADPELRPLVERAEARLSVLRRARGR